MKKGWVVKKLGEVCNIIGGGTPSKTNQSFYVDGNIPWATVRDMGFDILEKTKCSITEEAIKKSSTNIIPKGNVIIASRVGLGKVCILQNDTAINQDLRGILPINNKLTTKYLFYWFKNIGDYIVRSGKGATVHGVNLPFLKSLSIPIPSNPEQQRIVEILDSTFAKIDTAKQNAERNLQNAKELFQSVLNFELSLKEGWKEKLLGDVCLLYQGLAINAKTNHLLIDKSSLPLLRIKDLKNETEELYVKEEGYPPSSLVNKEDIIYTRTGSLGLVFTGRYGILHNNSFKIVPTNCIDKNYLIWFLKESKFKDKILSLAGRAAQPDITHKLFKEQPIYFPSLPEQQQIVSKLDALSERCKELEKNYLQTISDCDELKKAILAKAFNGEL